MWEYEELDRFGRKVFVILHDKIAQGSLAFVDDDIAASFKELVVKAGITPLKTQE